jgi:hypothetical protein
VEWHLRLPAHGTVTVGYVAAVAPGGTTRARLAGWAKGLDTIEKQLNTPAAKHTHPPRATPTHTYEAPAGYPSVSSPTATPSASSGNPEPWPTYSCDPTVITCQPNGTVSPSP